MQFLASPATAGILISKRSHAQTTTHTGKRRTPPQSRPPHLELAARCMQSRMKQALLSQVQWRVFSTRGGANIGSLYQHRLLRGQSL